jgi:hypothetical protein
MATSSKDIKILEHHSPLNNVEFQIVIIQTLKKAGLYQYKKFKALSKNTE